MSEPMLSQLALHERVIMITGANRGIGRAIAMACGAAGATVVLVGRNETELNRVYDEMLAAGYPEPVLLVMDLSQMSAEIARQAAEQVESVLGRLDGLVHNAADLGDITPIEMYDPDTWDRVMAINLRAPFVLTQALLPLLKQSDNAAILFTSSSVGRRARAFWGAYAVSKAGLENLARLLADELGNVSTLRVYSVNPGATRTQMRASAYPGENPETVKTAESIAPSFVALLSGCAGVVSGEQVTL